jgi:hypothetical protein
LKPCAYPPSLQQSFEEQAMYVSVSALIAAIASASAGGAGPVESGNFRFTATVPVVCRVNHGDVTASVSGDMIEIGQLERLCNDRSGYRLMLVHGPELAGSVFTIGDVATVIGSAAETQVLSANRPTLRSDFASIRLAAGQSAPTTLSFRMVPAGGI